MIVGWSEWCELPALGLPAIKAKIDTGAKTSAIHAFKIKPFEKDGEKYVQFDIHPIQRNDKIIKTCIAKIVDKRHVKNSGGQSAHRYIIETRLKIGKKWWNIEVSLTNRDTMGFRMLLGRQAMDGRIVVDPSERFCQKKLTSKQARKLYKKNE